MKSITDWASLVTSFPAAETSRALRKGMLLIAYHALDLQSPPDDVQTDSAYQQLLASDMLWKKNWLLV